VGSTVNEVTLLPVSYTHLDVYKRQVIFVGSTVNEVTLLLISLPASA
ncbi:hypothetical protein A5815_001528, partial [Enterococcus faecium]